MKKLLRVIPPKQFLAIAKISLAAGILAYILVCEIEPDDIRHLIAGMQWRYFGLGLLLQWLVLAIGTHRLQILLQAQDVRLSYRRTFTYNCIGFFFNLFALGSTGGDVVKAYYISRETAHRKTESVTIVFLDRMMGLASVLVIAAGALLTTLWLTEAFYPLIPYVLLALLVVVLAVMVVFTKNFWRRCIIVRRIRTYVPRLIRRIIGALHQYREHKWKALLALFESIILQLGMCVVAWCFGTALGFSQPGYIYFIVLPLGTLIMAMPLTPSGLGTGEYAFMKSFSQFGVSEDQSFSFMLLLRMAQFSISLVGFFFWLLPGTHVTRKELAVKTEEIEQLEFAE